MEHVIVTPTWRSLIPAIVHVAAHGETHDARAKAMDELYRLADIVDALVAEQETQA